MSISIHEAATLVRDSYKPHKNPALQARISDSLDQDEVQAHLLDDGTLLIPGSNSILDYIHFNLRIFRIGGQKFRLVDSASERGASGTIWHQGFLTHAKVVFDWVGAREIKMVLGHSLGAASSQILAKSWGKPGIGFAAPRPKKGPGTVSHDDKHLSICRVDDNVCGLPPNFHHMGDVRYLEPKRSDWGLDHSMKKYLAVLENNKGPDTVPTHWPLNRGGR